MNDTYIIEIYRNDINSIAHMADIIFGNYKSIQKFIIVEWIKFRNWIKGIYKIINIKDRLILITAKSNGVFCSKFE